MCMTHCFIIMVICSHGGRKEGICDHINTAFCMINHCYMSSIRHFHWFIYTVQEATKHRPLVLLKQAHIHPHPPPSSPSHSPSTNHQQARTVQRRERRKTTKQQATVEERGGQERQLVTDLKDRGERLGVHVHPLSSEEKLHANILIEKQRCI